MLSLFGRKKKSPMPAPEHTGPKPTEFFDLPLELRLTIWGMCIEQRPIYFNKKRSKSQTVGEVSKRVMKIPPIAIDDSGDNGEGKGEGESQDQGNDTNKYYLSGARVEIMTDLRQQHTPAILHICRESREFGLRHYQVQNSFRFARTSKLSLPAPRRSSIFLLDDPSGRKMYISPAHDLLVGSAFRGYKLGTDIISMWTLDQTGPQTRRTRIRNNQVVTEDICAKIVSPKTRQLFDSFAHRAIHYQDLKDKHKNGEWLVPLYRNVALKTILVMPLGFCQCGTWQARLEHVDRASTMVDEFNGFGDKLRESGTVTDRFGQVHHLDSELVSDVRFSYGDVGQEGKTNYELACRNRCIWAKEVLGTKKGSKSCFECCKKTLVSYWGIHHEDYYWYSLA